MAKKFASLMTEKGKTLIADAIAGGKAISLKYFAVGDGNGSEVTPSSSQTALVNEVARIEINSIKETDAAGQVVAAEAIIPADKGGFWIREAGIFTSDGVLIAVSQMPVTYKPAASEGASSSQIVRMMMAISNASAVNITVDDSLVIATEDFVNSRLKEHEKSRNHPDGTLKDKGFVQLSSATDSDDETRAATPKAVKAANDNADTRLKASENLADLTDSAKAREALALDKVGNWVAVQQGGGTGMKDNKVYLGWDGVHFIGQIDATKLGKIFCELFPPTAADCNAFPAEGGTVGGKGVTTPFLFANGRGAPLNQQGTWIEWNETNSQGESAFINNKGSGSGGFNFRIVNSDNTKQSGEVSISGNGEIYENGRRVYSPNNPPPYPVTSVNGTTGAVTTAEASLGAGWWKDKATGLIFQTGGGANSSVATEVKT
ncbi:hypothetical protein F3I53_22235, partial [Pantoea sp. VH_16]